MWPRTVASQPLTCAVANQPLACAAWRQGVPFMWHVAMDCSNGTVVQQAMQLLLRVYVLGSARQPMLESKAEAPNSSGTQTFIRCSAFPVVCVHSLQCFCYLLCIFTCLAFPAVDSFPAVRVLLCNWGTDVVTRGRCCSRPAQSRFQPFHPTSVFGSQRMHLVGMHTALWCAFSPPKTWQRAFNQTQVL